MHEQPSAPSIALGAEALEAERMVAVGADVAAMAESRLARVAGLALLAKGPGFVRGG